MRVADNNGAGLASEYLRVVGRGVVDHQNQVDAGDRHRRAHGRGDVSRLVVGHDERGGRGTALEGGRRWILSFASHVASLSSDSARLAGDVANSTQTPT